MVNGYKGETLAWVKTYDRAGVEAAINRSAKAQAAWKKQTALARADVLLSSTATIEPNARISVTTRGE